MKLLYFWTLANILLYHLQYDSFSEWWETKISSFENASEILFVNALTEITDFKKKVWKAGRAVCDLGFLLHNFYSWKIIVALFPL